jgi:hypothetical protein
MKSKTLKILIALALIVVFLSMGATWTTTTINYGNPSTLANHTYSSGSTIVTMTANVTIAVSRLVYITAISRVAYSDTSINVTCHTIGIAVTTATSAHTLTVLQKGYWRDNGWAFTPGAMLWLSTSGNVTDTQPSTSGYEIVPVGVALTRTIAFIKTDWPWLELN